MAAGKPRWFDSSAARPPAELAEALNIHIRLTNGPTARQRHRRLVSSPPKPDFDSHATGYLGAFMRRRRPAARSTAT